MINNSKASQSLCWRCIKANATPLGCSWFREGKMPKGAEFVQTQYMVWFIQWYKAQYRNRCIIQHKKLSSI
nr:MAG TPA: hypothetical protein [Caudoviricetes sp.]